MIVGVTGPLGAGKTTVCEMLARRGFTRVSCSDLLRELATQRGWEHTRDNLRKLGDELRAQGGPAAVAEKVLEKISDTKASGKWCIDSIRHPKEVAAVQKKGGVVIAVVASDLNRFDRVVTRKREVAEAKMDFDDFTKSDIHDRGMGIDEAVDAADFVIVNDVRLKVLEENLDEILQTL